jgi:hypothetical protein
MRNIKNSAKIPFSQEKLKLIIEIGDKTFESPFMDKKFTNDNFYPSIQRHDIVKNHLNNIIHSHLELYSFLFFYLLNYTK